MTLRPISRSTARSRLGVKPVEFARLLRAGAFVRIGEGLDPTSLAENYRRAVEIDHQAASQIAAIREEAARRLAELGASQPERKPLA